MTANENKRKRIQVKLDPKTVEVLDWLVEKGNSTRAQIVSLGIAFVFREAYAKAQKAVSPTQQDEIDIIKAQVLEQIEANTARQQSEADAAVQMDRFLDSVMESLNVGEVN